MRIQLPSVAAAAAVILALSVAPNAASAQAKTSVCKDGTSSSTTGKGACSGHGGVDAAKSTAASKAAASKAAAKPAPAATAAASKSAPVAAKKDAPAKKEVATKGKSDDKDPSGATAQCKDGTYSHAASHSGACSKHGGVAKFLK